MELRLLSSLFRRGTSITITLEESPPSQWSTTTNSMELSAPFWSQPRLLLSTTAFRNYRSGCDSVRRHTLTTTLPTDFAMLFVLHQPTPTRLVSYATPASRTASVVSTQQSAPLALREWSSLLTQLACAPTTAFTITERVMAVTIPAQRAHIQVSTTTV